MHPDARAPSDSVFARVAAVAAPFVLALAIYAPTTSYGYVALDDPWLIRDNAELREPGPDTIRRLFTDFSTPFRIRMGSEYLPVRDLSVIVDFALFGPAPSRFHVVQVSLYALLSALVGLVCLRYGRRADVALVAGLLFAAHPCHVEAVAWLSERKGLLSGVFALCAALTFYRLRECLDDSPDRLPKGRSVLWLGLTSVCVVTSIWSKAVGITTVPMIVLLAMAFPSTNGRTFPRPRLLAACFVWLGLVSAAAFIPVFRTGSLVHMVSAQPGWSEKLAIAAAVVGHYARQLVPVGPYAIEYPLARGALPPTLVLVGALMLSAMLFACARAAVRMIRTRTTRFHFGEAMAALALLFVFPVSHVLSPLQNLVADRYMLMLSIPAVLGLATLVLGHARPRIAALGLAMLVAVSASVSVSTASSWESTSALYRHALDVNPTNAEVMLDLAIAERDAGRASVAGTMLSRAAQQAERDHRTPPELLGRIRMHRALLLRREGRTRDAIALMRQAAGAPKADVANANLAHMLLEVHDDAGALRAAARAVRIRPTVARNHSVLGRAALEVGDVSTAMASFRRAIELAPRDSNHHFNLGVALSRRPDEASHAEAIVEFRAAVGLDPRNAAAADALRVLERR